MPGFYNLRAKVYLVEQKVKGFNWATSKVKDEQLSEMISTAKFKEFDADSDRDIFFWIGVQDYCYARLDQLKLKPKSLSYDKLGESFYFAELDKLNKLIRSQIS